jgi:hypothetical protein|tara:strand:- start:719 stop:2119 length:1401 start_codon:yes stop_codon:yes gene_type:complete
MKSLRKQGIIIFIAFALVLSACGGDAAEEEVVVEETTPEVVETLDSPAVTTAQTVKTGVGVTEEPCPAAYAALGTQVPTGADPEKGCIYLGLLNDYTGPFAAAGPALEGAQRAFWLWVNTTGGVGDYSVAIVDGYDTQYNPAKMIEGFALQKDDVAAFAMTLGSVQTQFILDAMNESDTIAAPMSWWSGWSYKSADNGLAIEFGSSYCAQGMNILDWGVENLPVPIQKIGLIAYVNPGYADDYFAGVKAAAQANGIEVAWEYVPPVTEFDVAAAVGLMATQPVDAVYMATDPNRTAQVSGGAAQLGVVPLTFMAAPAFNEAFVADGAPTQALFTSGAFYTAAWIDPYEADTPGHAAMRATWQGAMGQTSASSYVVAGWSSQYHLKGVLEAAIKGGDLTKAGIRRAAANVDVSSDGMMPVRTLGVSKAETSTSITAPDASVGSGTRLVKANYSGPTAQSHDWSQPCS